MNAKRCAFLLSFTFDDDSAKAYAFEIDGVAARQMGVPGMGAPASVEDGYAAWMTQLSARMEENFSSIHDVCGTEDEGAYVEGFALYETPAADAQELAECWRQAFVNRAGEAAVSELVSASYNVEDIKEEAGVEAALYASSTATETVDAIAQMLGAVRRRPRP